MVKNLPATWDTWVQSLGWEDTLEEVMASTPVFLPGESPWTEEPAGYSPWGHKESDMTERLSTHNIQLYIWINVTYDHIFFMHSSVKRHLVCFHVLAIVNSAAVNTGVHITFQAMFFFRYWAYIHRKSIYSFKWLIFLKTHYVFVMMLNIWIPLLQLTPLE